MVSIGVLALQGAFTRHLEMLEKVKVKAVDVRKPIDLNSIDGLIIPGGESTTIRKQLEFIKMLEPLKNFAKTKPIFGTCAGLILMSSEILNDEMQPFHMLNITVERNAFGRQYESFTTNIEAHLGKKKTEQVEAVFIRAPRIRHVGLGVDVLACFKKEPVLVRQGRHLGATFHPELTRDQTIHAYFAEIVKNNS